MIHSPAPGSPHFRTGEHISAEVALNPVGELIVALTELVEAEGRALRHSVHRAGWSLALIGLTAIFIAAGVALCLWALHLFMASRIGDAGATLIIGIIALIVAGGFAWTAVKMNR